MKNQKSIEASQDKAFKAVKRALVAKHTEVEDQVLMNRSVNMSNALVSSAQGLSLVEKRIMALAVSGLDSRRHYGLSAPTVTVTAADYAQLADIDPANAYKELQEGVKRLYERSIHFEEAWKPSQRKKAVQSKVSIRWVEMARYVEGIGTVQIGFTNTIMPHLTLLKERFTSYKLSQASALRSLYSWRILELLTQFETTGWREFEVDDFAKILELPATYTANFGHIKKRVIVPAVQELSIKDGWKIEVFYKKTGRKITKIRFEFEREKQGDLFK